MGQDGFVWWIGVVEDVADPAYLGRARVRIFGYHAPYSDMPVGELPWAVVVMPANLSDLYGQLKLGDWVLGFFLDGKEAQEPAILGYIPGFATSDENFSQNKSRTRNFHETRVSAFGHQFGTYIKFVKDDIFVQSPKGSYYLIDQLNWISKETHTTTGGSKRGPRNFTIGTRANPPAPSGGGGGGGGGCFTPDTLVTMADGTHKKIVDIEVGDLVYSRTSEKINRVRFVEIVKGERHKLLYSPQKTESPFATIDHPIYLTNDLCAVDPHLTEDLYPWLGKPEQLYFPNVEKNNYDKVYNLWVDGDGTYIVNGYGTTSIIYDGGMLSDFLEEKYFDADYIRQLYEEYTTNGSRLLHGAFVLNYFIGKYKPKLIRKIVVYAGKHKMNSWKRKLLVNFPMLITGALADITCKLHKWRFIK